MLSLKENHCKSKPGKLLLSTENSLLKQEQCIKIWASSLPYSLWDVYSSAAFTASRLLIFPKSHNPKHLAVSPPEQYFSGRMRMLTSRMQEQMYLLWDSAEICLLLKIVVFKQTLGSETVIPYFLINLTDCYIRPKSSSLLQICRSFAVVLNRAWLAW